ncbi:MAG: hypothetical protein LBL61_02955 [Elusimicrobiota bacterium]|jgi:hypothetical protein|nr:hypothetical protein [Elusimicrobiota bacterium]
MKTNIFTALKILAGVAGVLYLLQFLLFLQVISGELGAAPLDMWPVLAIASIRIATCACVFFVNAGKTLAQKILAGVLLLVFTADLLLQLFIILALGAGDAMAAAVNFFSIGLMALLFGALCLAAWQKLQK